jgi:hypothetical protein
MAGQAAATAQQPFALNQWRVAFETAHPATTRDEKAKRRTAFNRAKRALTDGGIVCESGERVWIA